MKLETTRFGVIEVDDKEVYTFPEGLLGFADYKRFLLVQNPTGGPLMWLQSADQGSLAFIVCRPELFKADYRVTLKREELESIELEKLEDGAVYTIMVVPQGRPKDMTANLQGPLIFNTAHKLAKQFVLVNTEYTTKHRVFPETGGARPAQGQN